MHAEDWKEQIRIKENKRNPRVFLRNFRDYGFGVFQAMEYTKDDIADLHKILWKNPKILQKVTETFAVNLNILPESETSDVLIELCKGSSGNYTKNDVYEFARFLIEQYGW